MDPLGSVSLRRMGPALEMDFRLPDPISDRKVLIAIFMPCLMHECSAIAVRAAHRWRWEMTTMSAAFGLT